MHSNAYHYGKKLEFDPKHKGALVYKTNRAVYQTADYVDTIVSTFSMTCLFKASQNIYWVAAGTAASPVWSSLWIVGWSTFGFLQIKYLMAAYLSQVFLIDEIEILEDLKQVRIRTMVHNSINLFTLARFNLVDKKKV